MSETAGDAQLPSQDERKMATLAHALQMVGVVDRTPCNLSDKTRVAFCIISRAAGFAFADCVHGLHGRIYGPLVRLVLFDDSPPRRRKEHVVARRVLFAFVERSVCDRIPFA